jgi:hypothetical protein
MEFREFSFGKKVINRTSDKDEKENIAQRNLFARTCKWLELNGPSLANLANGLKKNI